MPLHPQSEAFLQAVREANALTWSEMPIDVARNTFADLPFFGDAPHVAAVQDLNIAGVPVRIYRHHATTAGDVIVYFHGGGWVLGDIETHDALCRRLTNAAGATVVNVDYRNPPEHPFPAALDDCFSVCEALAKDAESLGVSGRMVVAGDSAGGNLAAAVSLKSRDQRGPEILGQVLIYPVIDANMSTASYKQFAEGFGLTRESMAWFWHNYLGKNQSVSRRDPLASPAEASDLSGLPATHVLTAEFDVLRDEGRAFAERLRLAGVPTTTSEYNGMLHAFVHFAAVFDDSAAATAEIGRHCRQMLDRR